MRRSLFYLILFVCGSPLQLFAQQFYPITDTAEYTEYVLENPDLLIAPSYEVLGDAASANPFQIIEQRISEKDVILDRDQILGLALSTDSVGVTEFMNTGTMRNKQVASLRIHVARAGENSTLVTEYLRIRVKKPVERNLLSKSVRGASNTDHPFATGTWFKIPVTKSGIYQLNYEYLQVLGVNVDQINPQNIQLWGTNGFMLAESNNIARPEFKQLPILVEGEADESFDSNDRVLFYGNSPHKVNRTESSFNHSIHPYSNTSYVFLTVSSESGERFTFESNSGSAVSTITSFTDFIWKEEELNKAEDRQRSGRYWLGQRIPATAQNTEVTIFQDTIPGVSVNQSLRISGRMYARALRTTNFSVDVNGTNLSEFSISRVSGGYLSYNGDAANGRNFSGTISPAINNNIVTITTTMSNADDGANGFVDYLRLEIERELVAERNRLLFMPPVNNEPDELARFVLQGFSSEPIVLDVTDPINPVRITTSASGSNFEIVTAQDFQRRIIAQSSFYTPQPGSLVPNQNLHGLSSYPDYIIVTSELFKPYADELAQHRTEDGLTPLVVTQNQILNEFSGGAKDPTAIRDFLKYLYDRANNANETLPRYLLLFGDTTYDTKNIVKNAYNNYVLTYQSPNSLSRIGSYASDDYFGFMDANEGGFISGSRIDIGIGRIPAQTRQEARIALNKIYRYENPENDGEWQNLFTFAGDDDFPDRDTNRDLHVWNADGTADRMNVIDSGLRLKKIYLFAYQEEITGSGREIPGASEDFINTLNNGTLVMNYSGHGNTDVLSDEELFSIDDIPSLTNSDRLSVIVTATCQFGRYDDINQQSGAEQLFFADNGGAIASFTTTRIVYTSSNPNGGQNFALNIALSQEMLQRDENGLPARLGDIIYRTKNTSAGASSNSRRFILIGDPALRLALPDKPAQLTTINDIDVASEDTVLTIRALDMVTLKGEVLNSDGTKDSGYNGLINVKLLDAKRRVSLPQDIEWIEDDGCYLYKNTERECTYDVENTVLFNGKANVSGGDFSIEFVLPKDISYSPDQARIVLFAHGDDYTAGGSFTNVIFNGVNENAENDGAGPELDIYLNDETFFNGDLTTDNPTLIVELADSSGINATGTGVGHEIIATIDTNPKRTFVLNEFYEGALNDFSQGRIEYPLDELPEGNYSLKVRAWDVHNNPSEESIFFEVAESDDLVIDKVYNYPNPMNNKTAFTFEHNQQGNALDVDIRIYTLSGKPVQHLQEYITNTSSSYASIPWNGRDRDYDRLGNGTYIYVLRVTTDTPEGRKSTEKIEKLVIIR
ncbi:MAG: type IX secretion system sortase PorU [Balneolaceae bacterium]|nr:type IX secretion system sortase PorU [Balneolaceae bacterium]